MKYDLVIFDCDGTLVDSEYVHNKILSDVLVSFGYTEYSPEYCIQHISGKSLVDIMHFFKDELKVNQPIEMIRECIVRNTSNKNIEIIATPYARELVSNVSSKKCVVSNGNKDSVLHSLEVTDIKDLFGEEFIFTHELVRNPKPAPDLFLYAAKYMNVDPSKAIVIEDTPIGIRGSKAANMKVIGYTGASHQDEMTKSKLFAAGADYVVANLKEVEEIIGISIQ